MEREHVWATYQFFMSKLVGVPPSEAQNIAAQLTVAAAQGPQEAEVEEPVEPPE